jgi:hypothetical protein
MKHSYFRTVADILKVVRGRGLQPSESGPSADAAKAAIPERFPHARMFMAWEVWYKNPQPRETVLEAMSELPKVKK